ncbi:hypothetical protein J2X56_003321 [Herbaspirillum sp. 1173]|nr:hypothetical protein [Herbaspirillum sp. 1173]
MPLSLLMSLMPVIGGSGWTRCVYSLRFNRDSSVFIVF